MASKTTRAQAFIESLTVAEMMMEFNREFRDVYPDHYLPSAVGPTQSFIGFCIQKGYMEVTRTQSKENTK